MINKIFNYVSTEVYKFRFAFKPAIRIGTRVRISRSAKLEVIRGGSISIGDKTEILHGALLMTYGGRIVIGRKCSINPYTIIYGHGNTKIGDNVLIAGQCMIVPSNHVFLDSTKTINSQGVTTKGIVIEDDVLISHGCSILDGVTIGKGSVIGAGSVVNKSIPPFSVCVGVPARVVSKR